MSLLESSSSSTDALRSSLMQVIVSHPQLLQHEEGLTHDVYNVSKWSMYINDMDEMIEDDKQQQQQQQLCKARCFVAERSISLLPGSYKLWRLHLSFLHDQLLKNGSTAAKLQLLLDAYERCLVRLHKAPRIWLEYLEVLAKYLPEDLTNIRRTFDRALQALPVTQHDKIWKPYLEWAISISKESPETSLRIYRRAVIFDSSKRQELAQVCVDLEKWGEACLVYLELLNDTQFVSPLGTSRHDLWTTFCNLVTQHVQDVSSKIDFDAIIRAALPKQQKQQSQGNGLVLPFDKTLEENTQQQDQQQLQSLGEMEGTLWTKLADYYVRLGEFEMARSIYQEALESVVRVRDFSIIFDSYITFEEGVMEAMMELQQDDEDEVEDEQGAVTEQQQDDDNDSDWDVLLSSGAETSKNAMTDMELAMARAEHLTTVRRPLLLNGVLLKQNPHNVGEWLRRADLYLQNNKRENAAAALFESWNQVDAKRAVNGLPHQLVTKLAQDVYKDDPEQARNVYRRVCEDHEYEFVKVDDLAKCYTCWVELELACEQWDEALSICRRGTTQQKNANNKAARYLYKSVVLWNLLLDLEESLGTVQTTKDAYNRALDLKVATPMHVLNFASFLQDQHYYEESFAAYERGVEMFQFPASKVLWTKYLKAFLERYKGTKMERARDLFERCLESCPPEQAAEFFMMQGELEEEYGLTKRALQVYQKICQTVPAEEKLTAYRLWIAKTQKYLGIPATRDIYQQAVQELQDNAAAAKLCLEFAQTETTLQELDRARAVLKYGAQLADPRRDPDYWKEWHDFEVSYGNEETFREMLRVKRSVQAAFSTVNYNAAEMGAPGGGDGGGGETMTEEQALSMIADREGVSVEDSNRQRIGGFVQAKKKRTAEELGDVESRVAKLRKATAQANVAGQQQEEDNNAAANQDDDEIDLDDDEGEEEEEEETAPTAAEKVQGVSTKAVPSGVFGGLKADDSSKKMGALERLRAAASSRTSSNDNDSPQ